MAGKIQGGDDVLADINVTPLVDIMLVLLIIFMLTNEEVSEKMKKPAIEVDLPKAASAREKPAQPISVVITKEGVLWLNGAQVSEAVLRTLVTAAARAAPGVEAVVSADRRVLHGSVVRVIDAIRLSGIEKIAVNTKEQDIE
ncbi:MAG: biopolymer transporter ExbD [Myxococcales bacterium]|nr:biopolymer transporter ExbD [Myxococcales bacterium]